jgi:phage-related minor tail protein
MSFEDDSGAPGRFAAEMRRAADEMRAADGAARGMAAALNGGLRRAMDEAVFGAGKLSDVLRGLAAGAARDGLRAATAPLRQAVVGGVEALAGRAVAGLAGGVRAFAKGGVVGSPTLFGAGDGVGLVGEAGPEAILPLARGADGRLGVRGGATQVTLNVTTPDVEGFRRSGSQVAAALARLVDRGRRRL